MKLRWLSGVFVTALIAGCGTPSSNPPVENDAANDIPIVEDGNPGDTGTPDAGTMDTGAPDTGSPDVVTPPKDTGTPDAGSPDTGTPDGGPRDVGPTPTDVRGDVPADVTPGAACAAPRATITMPAMTPYTDTMGATTGASSIPSTGCQPTATGPENAYTLTVTARTGVVIDTEDMRTNFDTVVSLRRTCRDAMTEVACNDDDGRDTTSIVTAVLDPGTYTVLVDGYDGEAGNYGLRVRSYTAAANATCAGATALMPGATLMNQDSNAGGAPSTACASSSIGRQLFYTVSVPANSVLAVRATPTGASTMWTPVLRALASCTATACDTSATAPGTGMAATLNLVNSTMAARTVTVSVASTQATGGTFDLSATMMTVSPGATCMNPIAITPGPAQTGQSTMGALTASTQCRTGSNGFQRYYSLSIPAGQSATVVATPTGMPAGTPVVRALESCTATTCVDSAVASAAGMPGRLVIPNPTMAARTVIVTVSNTTATPLNYDLQTTLAPLAMGSVCEMPVTLTATAPLTMQSTASAFRVSTQCRTTAPGAQNFYTVTIPPQSRGTVRATPGSGQVAVVRAYTGCMVTACIDSALGMAGAATALAVENAGTTPRTVIVSVSGNSATPITYDVALTTTPYAVQYTSSTTATMCDDVTMGTAIAPTGMAGWEDDSATPVLALPFGFRAYNTMASHFSVSSNGFVQLWSSMSGTPVTAYTNSELPATSPGAPFIAAFWDDLDVVSAMTTGVRTATLGTAPNRRFVVQWQGWTQVSGTGMERLTFQAKLFETTNVVELHYCSIMPVTDVSTGSSATIGMQGPTGTGAILLSHNTARAVNTTTAFRLTPR